MSTFISASMLNDYLLCSNKVFYRIFVKGISVPTEYMLIGTVVHKAIESFWNDKNKAILQSKNHAKQLNLAQKNINYIEHCIQTYFDNFEKFMTDKDEIEKNFKIKLYDDVHLVGKIDRISNGVIYDWKTSTKPPTKLLGDVQFIVYNYAYNLLYGKPPVASFLASLSTGNLVPYEHSDTHSVELFENVIPSLVRDIKNKSFRKEGIFKKGTCRFCSYKEDCLKGINENVITGSRTFAEK